MGANRYRGRYDPSRYRRRRRTSPVAASTAAADVARLRRNVRNNRARNPILRRRNRALRRSTRFLRGYRPGRTYRSPAVRVAEIYGQYQGIPVTRPVPVPIVQPVQQIVQQPVQPINRPAVVAPVAEAAIVAPLGPVARPDT